MQSLAMRILIGACLILSLSNCVSTRAVDDSYCVLYRPLITKKGDAAKFKSVPRNEKEIILGNEQIYQQTCPK